MDQDFHYYGTYYAARVAGIESPSAARIARASNFIDFMHEQDYGGRWRLVRSSDESDPSNVGHTDDLEEVATLANPRYTFQSGKLSTGVAPEDGLWCSFHFTPGNYDDVEAPDAAEVHGAAVAELLPGHQVRATPGIDPTAAKLLNRPQSPLSRRLLVDAIECATDGRRLEHLLALSVGGPQELLVRNAEDNLTRLGESLLGVRAHVIADTWAHQDWSGISHKSNTYRDIGDRFGRQAIEYQDVGDEWHHVVLSCLSHENLQAVPNGTSYLGHGWMGHFPDYSFVKYRYRPRWQSKTADPLVRDNPAEYRFAFLELCSLFSRSEGREFDPQTNTAALDAAQRAIAAPFSIADKKVCPRHESAERWLAELGPMYGLPNEPDRIDAAQEPDDRAAFDGVLDKPSWPAAVTRLGTYVVDVASDLYLFQIAADYHFQFVKRFLSDHNIRRFDGSWSQLEGPVSPSAVEPIT